MTRLNPAILLTRPDATTVTPFQFRGGQPASKSLISLGILERAKGFEPSTPTLARLCSTPELRPRSGKGVAIRRLPR
jgi:hypothetical protein